MFINNKLTKELLFLRSKNINVFPCGRRRSEPVDRDMNEDTVSDRYYIPFDPEARLNTEANNRKHSGLNGFKQNYLNYWKADSAHSYASFVIAGYLFNIKFNIPPGYSNDQAVVAFGDAFEEALGSGTDRIFANIKLANIAFFSGAGSEAGKIDVVSTEILRDQTLNIDPASCLDAIIPEEDNKNSNSYYFSGLSFSAKPLNEMDIVGLTNDGVECQQILEKKNGIWQVYEPFKLPRIDHGDTEDSIKIYGDLYVGGKATFADTVTAPGFQLIDSDNNTLSIPALALVETSDDVYQLQFTNATIKNLN